MLHDLGWGYLQQIVVHLHSSAHSLPIEIREIQVHFDLASLRRPTVRKVNNRRQMLDECHLANLEALRSQQGRESGHFLHDGAPSALHKEPCIRTPEIGQSANAVLHNMWDFLRVFNVVVGPASEICNRPQQLFVVAVANAKRRNGDFGVGAQLLGLEPDPLSVGFPNVGQSIRKKEDGLGTDALRLQQDIDAMRQTTLNIG
mmetsp:Transcript_78452/g.131589  ORF Transcript_78452/g.131589 Transcript_78452/m.131589 type:complete len:202 (-) Transcript_78452:564-1169(-)